MSEKVLAGRYEVIEKIGDGGMAVVYKGKDRLLNRFVAIKVLRPEYTKDAAFVDSFRRESQAAARLSHPSIVNMYDVGREGNIHYLVMELVEGKTLSDLIREEAPLDYKRAIGIAKQIASALSLAHKNNIIHRDVKPHNILIMPDGSAKITDFGIAKAVTDATIVGKSEETVMGSVHYFSPEQARGGYVDEKSDIYSLGIVLYEMLTGMVPFDAENPVTVAVMHMNERPTPPSQLVSGIPPGLEQIVMKAMEKYQINRFKTADDMYEALENVNFITGIIENPAVADLFQKDVPGEDAGGGAPEDADGGAGKKKKRKKQDRGTEREGRKGLAGKFTKVRVIAIALALICAIPVSYFIYAGLQTILGPKEIELPDVLGMTEEEAAETLEALGLKLFVADLVADAEVEEGRIVSQERSEGSVVKEGFTLRVSISRGQEEQEEREEVPIVVPNVVGRSLEDAAYQIESYGYRLGSTDDRENSKLPKDYVVRQSPNAGEEAEEGARIDLVLSDGEALPEKVSVPNLLALTEDAARRQIEGVGLKVGTVTPESNATYETGKVIWQQHEPGTELPVGSEVAFKVSSGIPSNEPRTVSIDIDFANAPEEEFYLAVLLSDSSGQTVTVVNNVPRYKSTGGDSVPVTGRGEGTVYVLFNDVQAMVFSVDFSNGVVR
jgi:serine/threonine-protein kinase